MNNIVKNLKLNGLKVCTKKAGDILQEYNSEKVVLIVSGAVMPKRYIAGEVVTMPYIAMAGDTLGLEKIYYKKVGAWDFYCLEDTKYFELTQEEVQRYLLTDVFFLNNYIKKLTTLVNTNLRAYLIQSQGGAKPTLAYLLYNFSIVELLGTKKYRGLSNILNISETALQKIFREFERRGVLIRRYGTLEFLKKEELKSYFESYVYW